MLVRNKDKNYTQIYIKCAGKENHDLTGQESSATNQSQKSLLLIGSPYLILNLKSVRMWSVLLLPC